VDAPARILVLADDLTGAMDAAGPFASRGLTTRVVVQPAGLDPSVLAGVRVVSVNTASRHLPAARAAEQVLAACAALQASRFELVIKKVDSTLRGNVVAETLAALQGCARPRALVATAFPAQGRTVHAGVVHVHGRPLAQTAFARDALSPALAAPLPEAFAGQPVEVLDGHADTELDAAAAQGLAQAARCLLVGSAGLTGALARALGEPGGAVSEPHCRGRVLYVVGSRAEAAREQCQTLVRAGAVVLDAPAGHWHGTPPPGGDLVLLATTADPARPDDAQAVAGRLARAALALAGSPDVGAVVATGGDTALALLSAAGVASVEVGGELMPGIAFARLPLAGGARWLVTKAGGFGDGDALAAIGRRLRGADAGAVAGAANPGGRLERILNPASIAVVGAGERPGSSGGAVLRNLRLSGFRGRVVPVNPKGGVIQGLPAATSLQEVQPPADLVAVLVRPEAILDVAQEAAHSGHRNLLILPGGFAEAGAQGRARDGQLRRLALDHDLLVAGPNCAGVVNLLDSSRPFAATFFRDLPRGGPVALVSQSGAIAEEMIAASHALDIPLGAVVSVGNGMHLAMADYLDHLGEDPHCKAILLYAESFGDADRFAAVARRVSSHKPVIALAGGRTAAGGAAALRHTGASPGADAQVESFLASAGVLRVHSLRELRLAGKVFGLLPRGAGGRVLILSNSGGPGVLAADRAVAEGLELVALPLSLERRLTDTLPPEAAVANPIDLLADAREDRFEAALAAVLEHMPGQLDTVLMVHVVPFMVDAQPVVQSLARVVAGAPVAVLHSMMGTLEHKAQWFATLAQAGVPCFDDTEDMCIAAGLLWRYRQLHAHRAAPATEENP
jgi:acetyltransferase